MQRTNSLENTLMLGKSEGGKRRGGQGLSGCMASLTWWTWVWVGCGSWWWTGKTGVLQSMGLQSQTQLIDSTELNWVTNIFTYVLVFGGRAFKQKIKIKQNNKGGSQTDMTGTFKRTGSGTRSACAQKKDHVKIQQEHSHAKVMKRSHQKSLLLVPWS